MSKKVLGRKKRQKRRGIATTDTSCQESLRTVKQRVKYAKEDVKTIMDLIRGSDVVDYDIRYELVGKAHMNLYYAKEELARRKVLG